MDTFGARSKLRVGHREYEIFRLDALERYGLDSSRLPFSLRVLLENLLRLEDGRVVTADDIRSLAGWDARGVPSREIAFVPARVLLQDFTGVPVMVDLAAMRDAMAEMGGDPARINPMQPVELVIDHSVQVDAFGTAGAMFTNIDLEFARNRERYAFLRWSQKAFRNCKIVPPGKGIVHQVNLEYLARVVFGADDPPTDSAIPQAFPDTLVGTDSHTTMVNGLGVLGWGVGGIEAEAAMLGQPISMLIPQVVGFRLTGQIREGATATDLVLTVTEMLRKKGVVGKFVEFFGSGLARLPVADRATISNMAPEYGATCGIFPVDAETLRYLRLTGRSDEHVELVEAYMKEQGLFQTADSREAEYSDTLELDLACVEPSVAGPKRPQDRVGLSEVGKSFYQAFPTLEVPNGVQPRILGRWEGEGGSAAGAGAGQQAQAPAQAPAVAAVIDSDAESLRHGSVVIAAITSCTNTSNPSVMIAAGLVAKKAVERGLERKPWVKTSLAPGSRVVTEYYADAGLTPFMDRLGFQTVGYGCTTCIGNSGPLPPDISQAVEDRNLVVCSVLSGNRNFEGRINALVKANYLMSPPLVVAYAIAGRIDIDLEHEPLGTDRGGRPVYLRDIWPSQSEVQAVIAHSVRSTMFRERYRDVLEGDEHWSALPTPEGDRFDWDPASTYIKRPPYFLGMPREAPARVEDIRGARVLALLGDSVTTDHISPAGSIKANSPPGKYLIHHGVEPKDFNSYGSRRGNHEVMVRGTFANVRLRNQLAPGTEGGFTTELASGQVMTIFDASVCSQERGVPLLVIAGKEYGSGSSRDWAAKGPLLLGIRGVIAESFERIHRSNLIGMGVLPLEFEPGQNAASLGITGHETFAIVGLREGLAKNFADGRRVRVEARPPSGEPIRFAAVVRLDTAQELLYYRHGGILQYVLRQLLSGDTRSPAMPKGLATTADPKTGSQPT